MMRKTFKAILVALIYGPALTSTIDMFDAGDGTYAMPVASMKAARYLRTVHQHFDFSYGSATVATLLAYQYGYPVSERAVFQAMYKHDNQEKVRQEGFSLLDIKRYLASLGFKADDFEQPLDILKGAHLSAIVLLTENGYHSFVVVRGIQEGRVLVGGPVMDTHTIPRANFESMWDNHLLFVVHNHEAGATFNASSDWCVAPRAPLEGGMDRSGLRNIVVPRHGPSDF